MAVPPRPQTAQIGGTSSNSGRGVHEDNLNKEELLWEGSRWWSTMSKDETLLLQAGR